MNVHRSEHVWLKHQYDVKKVHPIGLLDNEGLLKRAVSLWGGGWLQNGGGVGWVKLL